jgi:hypothetical protein
LHYKYSSKIDCTAGETNSWAFIIRNNLLIGDTTAEIPVIAAQLELLSLSDYAFVGKANADKKGIFGEDATAALSGDWKASQ